MIELLRVSLEAHNDERNHHRSYEVAVGRDLLGDWVVVVRYGRVEKGQHTIQFGSPGVDGARRFARERLRRRLSASRRIGCAYQIRARGDSPQAQLADWIPAALAFDTIPMVISASRL